ncbi:hypothetical protein ACP4OV_012831 [Aristida adscensionis]
MRAPWAESAGSAADGERRPRERERWIGEVELAFRFRFAVASEATTTGGRPPSPTPSSSINPPQSSLEPRASPCVLRPLRPRAARERRAPRSPDSGHPRPSALAAAGRRGRPRRAAGLQPTSPLRTGGH